MKVSRAIYMAVAPGLRYMTELYLFLLLLLLPLKFGNAVNIGEIGIFPLQAIEWLFASWPPFLLAPLSGLALLLAVLVNLPLRKAGWRAAGSGLVWLLLLLFSLLGFWRASNWDFALRFFWHLLGVSCLAIALMLMVGGRPASRRWFLTALAVGGLWVVLSGWQQVPGGGLQVTLDYAEEMARSSGVELPESIRSRLERGRAFGTFVYPNSFAAHLLLIGPVLLFFCYNWGVAAGLWMRREPWLSKRLQAWPWWPWLVGGIMTTAGLVLWGGALWFSGSRAAVTALVLALTGAILVSLRRWKIAVSLALAALLLGAALFAVRQRGQDLASLDARFDYWRAAGQMVLEYPIAGVGMGDFFYHYMRLKRADMEETRLPHNGFLFFAAQAGIMTGLVFLLLVTPALALLVNCRDKWGNRDRSTGAGLDDPALGFAIGVGCLAWFIHTLTDFNMVIPGTVSAMAILPVIFFASLGLDGGPGKQPGPDQPKPGGVGLTRGWRCLFVGCGLLAILGLWRWPGDRDYRWLDEYRVTRQNLPQFEEEVEKVAALLPWSPHPWQLLGHRAEALEAPVIALRAYRRAAERSPRWASMWFGVARNELMISNLEAAREAFEKGLEWYPESPAVDDLRSVLQPVEVERAD